MKQRFLILALVISVFLITSSFAFAQDPDDPGDPDTLWISSVTMSEVYSFGIFHDFAIECSVWTDDILGSFMIPISFYHSQNRDIVCDSVIWDSLFVADYYPDLAYPDTSDPADIDAIHNDSAGADTSTPKVFSAKVIYFSAGYPSTKPAKRRLFTAWFHAFGSWDNSKSIVLDSVLFRPPAGGTSLEFEVSAETFRPVFHYGVIGDSVTISGNVSSYGGSPDSGASVYCKGKDVTTSFFPGRELEKKTDGSGNYSFAVGEGGDWCVFRDTVDQMQDGVNAYCFAPLSNDTTGIDFDGKFPPGQGVFITGTSYLRYPKPDSSGAQAGKVRLSGDMEDQILPDGVGNYELSVPKGGNYYVWMDTGTARTDTNSWSFTSLSSNALGKDFIFDKKGKEAAQGALISGKTYYEYPDSVWSKGVHVSGWYDFSGTSDDLGYYEIGIPKGRSWHDYQVYVDTNVGMSCGKNAYCFSDLNSDQSNKDFEREFVRGMQLWISGIIYLEEPGGDTLAGRVIYVSGDLEKTGSSDTLGMYEIGVYKGGEYWVWHDTGSVGYTPDNSYHFTNLQVDTANNDFAYAGSTDVPEESELQMARDFWLFQNYPNPFNPHTVVKFYIPEDCWVKVEIFNLLGQKIRTLADQAMGKGMKQITWDGKNEKGTGVASGIYFYRIKTEEFTDVKKMILVK